MRILDMKAAFTAGDLSVVVAPAPAPAPAKLCDSCKSSTSVIFCRADSAFLCLSCDSKLHCLNNLTSPPHPRPRVWMCEVCEQAPAAVTCKADAAALCVQCDFDIHSANPLASRHERVPVEPFYDSAESVVAKSSDLSFFSGSNVPDELGSLAGDLDATNWTVHNSNDNSSNNNNLSYTMLESSAVKNDEDLFFSETMDPFLNFEFPSYYQQSTAGSVVPVLTKPVATAASAVVNHSSHNCFEIDFGQSMISSLNYSNYSISQSVSSSEVGVVPDGNYTSDMSHPFGRNVNAISDSSVSGSTSQAFGLDREARVMRYREKRKNRKFEKTIRYASRKAYAEKRPRIKGRFAKRPGIGAEMDQTYGSASLVSFGVVPHFWS